MIVDEAGIGETGVGKMGTSWWLSWLTAGLLT